jgi:DNA-directed RNA polymerase specialized sigma24 family protein
MALSEGTAGPLRREWTLSPAAFARLLATLDPDPEAAGERYERMRARLARMFEWRGCADPAELVDLTFDRVARRLEEGAEITARDPYAYLHGVALHVLQEHRRLAGRLVTGLEEASGVGAMLASPIAATAGDDDDERERRLACLDRCLGDLPAAERRLLEEYHVGETDRRIRRRQALAAELGVTLNALRIQVHRLRQRLRSSVDACAGRPAAKRIVPIRTSEGGPSSR